MNGKTQVWHIFLPSNTLKTKKPQGNIICSIVIHMRVNFKSSSGRLKINKMLRYSCKIQGS